MINPDLSKTIETQVGLRGAAVASTSGSVLSPKDTHAHNIFDQRMP
jgi:hypothetical protein